jgi:hypothetical protein
MIYTHTVRSRTLKEVRLAGFLMVRNFVQDKFREGYKQGERDVNPLINLKNNLSFPLLAAGRDEAGRCEWGGTSADRGRAPSVSKIFLSLTTPYQYYRVRLTRFWMDQWNSNFCQFRGG